MRAPNGIRIRAKRDHVDMEWPVANQGFLMSPKNAEATGRRLIQAAQTVRRKAR